MDGDAVVLCVAEVMMFQGPQFFFFFQMEFDINLTHISPGALPGGPAAHPGEARAQPGGPEEAGGDQGVLAGPGEHHPGQSPPALRGQQGRPAGAELREPGPAAGPAGGPAGLRGPGTGLDQCQQATEEAAGGNGILSSACLCLWLISRPSFCFRRFSRKSQNHRKPPAMKVFGHDLKSVTITIYFRFNIR